MDIGNRIKTLRMKKALTLEELADRTELSKGFLSQLERNLTSPSITTLENITEVLGISLTNFFKEENDERISFTKDDYYVKKLGNSKITWLVPDAQKNEMEPILYELSKGDETFEVKAHEGEEFGFVLRGTIELINESKNTSVTLKKGDTFYLTGADTHYIKNNEDNLAKFIWVSTPPTF